MILLIINSILQAQIVLFKTNNGMLLKHFFCLPLTDGSPIVPGHYFHYI